MAGAPAFGMSSSKGLVTILSPSLSLSTVSAVIGLVEIEVIIKAIEAHMTSDCLVKERMYLRSNKYSMKKLIIMFIVKH